DRPRAGVAAPGREGRQRWSDLSSLFRGAMVEGRAAAPGGCPVRGERGHLFPGQRRSLVYLADGFMGRRPPGQGRPGPILVPGRRGRLWLRPFARGRTLSQPGRDELVGVL